MVLLALPHVWWPLVQLGHAFITVSRQLAKVIGAITAESNHMALALQSPLDNT